MPSRGRADSESESLVNREVTSYTEEGGYEQRDEIADDLPREMDYVEADVSVLSQFHEDALTQAGFGVFQGLLFIVLGLGLAADAVELFVVAYVMPSAERELCMGDSRKGWLAAISFLGMMIGGLVWGTLADRLGRRRTLLSALATNACFSVATAFMPLYGLLLLTRLCSGIGVGGSLPIVFTYYAEFLMKRKRGRHLSYLLIFWAFGGVFAALMAWSIIPHDIASSYHELSPLTLDEDNKHLSRWRIFLLVCSIPAVLSAIGLCFLPESPRYLLECGKDVEAMCVYQKIFKMNQRTDAQYQLSELELPTGRTKPTGDQPPAGFIADILEGLETFWNSFAQILWPPFMKTTLVLLIVWVTTSFGFYGMSIWFPEYIRKLEQEDYDSRTTIISHHNFTDGRFYDHLENTRYEKVVFTRARFEDLLLNHCVFDNCTFVNCTFYKIRSSRTFFVDSVFQGVTFQSTDLYDYRFIGCIFKNSTFLGTVDGCGLDFDVNNNLSSAFLSNLIAQLAIIPGNFLSSYALDSFGRVRTLGASLFLTSLSAFFIWFLDDRTSVIAFEAIFNFISISGWNAVDIISTESYPTSLRSTGYGFLSAISRLAAIFGNLTFARFISISRTLPVLTTAAVLLIGSIFSFKLNETRDALM